MKLFTLICLLSISCNTFAATHKKAVVESKTTVTETVSYYNENNPEARYTKEYVESLPNAIFVNEQDYRGNRLRTTDTILPNTLIPQWHSESLNQSVHTKSNNVNVPRIVEEKK